MRIHPLKKCLLMLFMLLGSSLAFALAPPQLPPPPTAATVASETAFLTHAKAVIEYLKAQPDDEPTAWNKMYYERLLTDRVGGEYNEVCQNGNCRVYFFIHAGSGVRGHLFFVKSASASAKEFTLGEITKMYQAVMDHKAIADIVPYIVTSYVGFQGVKDACKSADSFAHCEPYYSREMGG